MRELLKEMLSVATTCGCEEKMRTYISGKISDKFDESKTDSFGNLILHRSGKGKSILLCAPIDDFGVIVTRVEGQKIFFDTLGKLDVTVLSGRRICFENGVQAVIMPCKNSEALVAFAGDNGKERADISVGQKGFFQGMAAELCGGYLVGSGIDSRVGAAFLINAVINDRLPKEADITLLFYAQSKIDDRGAYLAASEIAKSQGKPIDMAVVITSCPESDTLKTGGGTALCLAAKSYVCNSDVRCTVENYFKQNDLEMAYYCDNDVSTPASLLSRAYTGIPTVHLMIPIRSPGTNAETVRFD